VANSAISRLLGQHALPPEVASALDDLAALARQNPALQDACERQAAIVRVIGAREPAVGELMLAPERAAEKRAAGIPLLRGEALPIDMDAVRATLLQLCAVLRVGATDESAGAIEALVQRGVLDIAGLAHLVVGGKQDELFDLAERHAVSAELLAMLLRFSLFAPMLRLAAKTAALRARTWSAGFCPTCGCWPLLAEQRGLEQLRYLRCGLCADEWQVSRLACVLCGNDDHRMLGYLHVETQESQRAATCEHCHGYVKVLATLSPMRPYELLVRDLATLHLDLIALERGYGSPA
jgi:FdhE protein